MGSELSTGVFGMVSRQSRTVATKMLVSNMSASFSKPARGTIRYTCNDGIAVDDAVARAIENASSERVLCTSIGTDEMGDVVSRFEYEWWFSSRKK